MFDVLRVLGDNISDFGDACDVSSNTVNGAVVISILKIVMLVMLVTLEMLSLESPKARDPPPRKSAVSEFDTCQLESFGRLITLL